MQVRCSDGRKGLLRYRRRNKWNEYSIYRWFDAIEVEFCDTEAM